MECSDLWKSMFCLFYSFRASYSTVLQGLGRHYWRGLSPVTSMPTFWRCVAFHFINSIWSFLHFQYNAYIIWSWKQIVSSAIIDKYIGESARLIREMFGYARDHQVSTEVFISLYFYFCWIWTDYSLSGRPTMGIIEDAYPLKLYMHIHLMMNILCYQNIFPFIWKMLEPWDMQSLYALLQ